MKLLFIAVLAFSAISVFRAEKFLFVQKGRSVHLDVQEYERPQIHTLSWNFNSTKILEYNNKHNDLTLFNYYKNSSVFDEKNFTLLLKNVQERDSGIYTADITDVKGQQIHVANYRLTVQEAPPTPQVALLSSAGGFCNVSVNCSAKDTWASYTCEYTQCTRVANTTLSTEVTIIVTANNEAISCSCSNRVGTKTQSTKHVCTPILKDNSPVGVTVVTIIIISIIIFITIVYVIYKRRRISGGSQIQEKYNTEYASVEGPGVVLSNPSTVETLYETVTTAMPEHHPEGNTVYDMLGPVGDPPAKAETIYTTVIKVTS